MNCEIPEAYGGLGLSCLSHCLVLEEISYGCTGINTTMAGNMLGTMPLILAGTDEQKKQYFGRLLAEPIFAAYCCSEPDAGSDVAGMKTPLPQGGRRLRPHRPEALDHQRRRGELLHGLRARGRDRAATRASPASSSTATPPASRSARRRTRWASAARTPPTCIFEDVKVPKANLVGDEGEGFKVAMRTFDRTRPWIAAGAAGLIRRALDESRTYALERKTFGVPIAQHQAIQFMLAEMAIAYESTRLLYHKAAWAIDNGKLDTIVSSYAKAYGADAAMRVATDAVQIFGGYGYTKEYPVEKLMRDAKLLQIYEGTSQIQRMVIARNILGG